jgi:flotillin
VNESESIVKRSDTKYHNAKNIRVMNTGGVFVYPVLEDHSFLYLNPMQVPINLESTLTKKNIRVSIPSEFTVAIGTTHELMMNAAQRLLGLTQDQIVEQASEIIFGQVRDVIASMELEDINSNREMFAEAVKRHVSPELAKVGLVGITSNFKNMADEGGVIAAKGLEIATRQKNESDSNIARDNNTTMVLIAKENAAMEYGQRKHQLEKEMRIKNEEHVNRIAVQEYETSATMGENASRQSIIESNAQLQIKTKSEETRVCINQSELESQLKTEVASNESHANINESRANSEYRVERAQYEEDAGIREAHQDGRIRITRENNEREVEEARAEKKKATFYADVIVAHETSKQTDIIDSEAQYAKDFKKAEQEADSHRTKEQARADAIYAILSAQARGNRENAIVDAEREEKILIARGDGMDSIIKACNGDPDKAFRMLMLQDDMIVKVVHEHAQAIKGIKFDNVTVWDNKSGGDTAGFIQNLTTSMPGLNDVVKNVGGKDMSGFLGGYLNMDDKSKK